LKTAVIIIGSILIIAIVYFFFIKKKEQGIAVGTNAQGQPVDASGNIVDVEGAGQNLGKNTQPIA
jgi:hypothetical protein